MARTSSIDELTADQELIVQAIESGSYFTENETPTGSINGINKTFVLAVAPNPAGSLRLYWNGQLLKAGGVDFTLSGASITMNLAPETNDILIAHYRVDPT